MKADTDTTSKFFKGVLYFVAQNGEFERLVGIAVTLSLLHVIRSQGSKAGVTKQSNEVTSNEVTRNPVTGKKLKESKVLKSF